MILIINLNNTPRIFPSTNFTPTTNINLMISSNNSKGHTCNDFFNFLHGFRIVAFVDLGLEDLDFVKGKVFEDLMSELGS